MPKQLKKQSPEDKRDLLALKKKAAREGTWTQVGEYANKKWVKTLQKGSLTAVVDGTYIHNQQQRAKPDFNKNRPSRAIKLALAGAQKNFVQQKLTF